MPGAQAATPWHSVQNLAEYQSYSNKRVSGMDCVDEVKEVAVFRWLTKSGLTDRQ